MPAESYLDTGNRAAFANGGAHMILHPDFAPLSWDNACAPLCTEGSPPIPAVRSRLRVRAMELSGLHVEADGRAIRPAALKGSRLFQFLLPAAREVRIISRAGAKIDGILLDGKVVGGWTALPRQTT